MPAPTVLAPDALAPDLQAAIGTLPLSLRTASSLDALLEVAAEAAPALIVMELSGPRREAIATALARLREFCPTAPLLVIATSEDPRLMQLARDGRASIYLVRPVHTAQLRASIELSVGAVEAAQDNAARGTGRSGTYAIGVAVTRGYPELRELSSREREVFSHLVEGQRVADISKLLFISRHTVRQHAKSIFRKLGMHSQIELMRRYGTAFGQQALERVAEPGTDYSKTE